MDVARVARGFVAWAFIALATPSAFAQGVDDATRAAARQLGYSGVEAYEKGDFPTASKRLEKAYSVLRVPSLGLWSARALEKIGKLVEAQERYLEIGRLDASGGDRTVQEEAQRDAQSELEALKARVPNLVVLVEGAEPSEVAVSVDGAPLATALIGEKRPINPGRHTIQGQKGSERAEAVVEVGEGVVRNAVLRFGAAPGAVPSGSVATKSEDPGGRADDGQAAGSTSARRVVSWALIGLGGAALVTGTITGVVVLSTEKELEESDACREGECLETELDRVKTYNNLRGVSTISLIAGGVLATTGVVLLVTEKKSAAPSAALVLGPGSAAIRGRF